MSDLIERLQNGVVEHPKRWSGDTHYDLGGSVDYEATGELMDNAAQRILADAEALKAADALAGEIQTAISCAGPSDFWVSAARQALFNYRKARGGE